MIVLEWLFLTIAPCDAAEPWQLGFQDAATPMMQGIIDLHHDIKCLLVSLLFYSGLSLWKFRFYWLWRFHFYWHRFDVSSMISLFLLLCLLCVISCIDLQPNPYIAYCDGGNAFTPPPSPVQLPEQPVTPPEEPPVPQPVVIPQLAQPLISDDTRRSLLYNRYLLLNFGGNDDLRRMLSIIDAQVIVERYVEAALVDDGFNSHSILSRYTNIRGILHSPQGGLLSQHTYDSYVTQIREHGTRESVPYRRIMRAIQNYDLLLER